MALHRQFARGFVQRAARHLYQDGELVEALDVCGDQVGALTTRPGHTVVAGPLAGLDVTALHTAYTRSGVRRLYAQAGTTLYRDGVALVTGLTPSRRMTFANLRGLGEHTLYTFAANGDAALRVKDDGTTLTAWGLNPPSAPVSAAPTTGTLEGSYRWRVTFLRKAIPPNVRYGTYQGASVYTETTTSPTALTTLTNNDGHLVGAGEPFAEIFYDIATASSGGSPVWAYAYWDGSAWVGTTPVVSTLFTSTGRQRVTFDFPTTHWRPQVLNGQTVYAIRALATTAPTTAAPIASTITVYDSVIAAESNPSAASNEVTLATEGGALSSIPNPAAAGVDFDAQVTHVGIYRTIANQSLATSPFFFASDVLAGTSSAVDGVTDDALLGLLVFDNDRPPAFGAVCEHQNRLWGLKDNRVYPSKFEQPEAFAPQMAFDVGTLSDPPLTLWSEGGVLYVATGARIYQIVGFGQDAGGNPLFIPQETLIPTGLGASGSVVHGERADYFLGSDGSLWRQRGPAQAENLSDAPLYPLFHRETVNGVAPLNQAARSAVVCGFLPSKIFVSYPAGTATVPSATLVYDEGTGIWFRDSRGFRSFHYDRIANVLYAGTTTGLVLQVGHDGTVSTDAGTVITPVVQTRDDDEGQPQQDKRLVELGIDAATLTAQVTVVADYVRDPVLLGTSVHPTRSRGYLPAPAVAPHGFTLGYHLTWSGPGTLYQLFPQVLLVPPTQQQWRINVTDLGWPGKKVLSDYTLDLEWVGTGAVTVRVFTDRALTDPPLYTHTVTGTAGHRVRFPRARLPAEPFTLVTFELVGTVPYRLWPTSRVSWHTLGGQPGLQTLSLTQAG